MASRTALPDDVNARAACAGRRPLGRLLASRLEETVEDDALVLGIARGGVVVADEVARTLNLPMDVLVVHRITEPDEPHLSLGAVAEPGHLVVHRQALRARSLKRDWLRGAASRGVADATQRGAMYRAGRPAERIAGRQVILVDDAAGTGAILRAAVKSVQGKGAREVIVAVPVAPARVVAALERHVEHVVCLCSPAELIRYNIHYPPPEEVTDDEICRLLEHQAVRKKSHA